jgi:membrane-associated phospholipid phosphatase
MACTKFLSDRFHLGAAEPALFTFVIAIGAGRIVDGQHWLSDTVMGGLFGYVVGHTIAGRFGARDRASPPAPLAIRFSWTF